ncbi:anthocyanidin 3-O-glucosyltransferase 5-like [Herrania umbratica]|uniref:Glycosyltransferase n=1 Tax=Herrania umbratica TaxID=108875 RepID=A0A6J0ZIJ2_9ROSI|nr:anthocyanidin 3-O-glucosyltransferase 5-like [Herrania umbratica]
MQTRKPHAALLASPGMGHLTPVVELGKRLVSHHGFSVTIFVVATDTSLSQSQLLKLSQTSYHLEVVLLPPVDISGQIDQTTSILTQLAMMMREALPSLRSAISAMTVPPVALIVDMFGTEAFAIAEEFMMQKYVFITSNAWFLALTVHAPAIGKKEEDDHVNNQKPLVIPGCKPICFVDSFEPILKPNNQVYEQYLRMGTEISTADGILVNTFQELEPQTLAALNDKKKLGLVANAPVYPIGPLVRPAEPGVRNEVLSWLDMQPKESVIYVSFGSGGTLSAKQTTELAWGLEKSLQRFVWVLRLPVENDSAATVFKTSNGCADYANYLPDGFLNRTSKTGLVVPMWAPQTEILNHPSIGGFLSHGGWNSSLESIVNGVPMIVWPLYAEQKMNAAMLAEHIGMALRLKLLPSEDVIERSEIEAMVRKLLVGKEGEAFRARVKMLKSWAEKALSNGGGSYNSLANVAKDCEISLQSRNTKAGA